ncbi:MAG: family 16 glycosylhydrolase [Ardenticatenaceae bacterium]|nr:family 16 glycosylhydrolase [Ardenticatenaceae bacterium]
MNHKKFPILLLLALCSILAVAGLMVMLSPATAVASPHTPAADFPVIADFEGGVPAGWFVYGDWGNITITITNPTITDTDPLALPGQVGSNDILSVTANIPTWAGFGAGLVPTQDWSDYDALSFWYYGQNLSTTHEVEIQTAQGDDRRATFVDDFTGWRQIILPFSTFGPGGAYDVSQVDNWVFVLDGTIGSFKLDHLNTYGDAGNAPLKVQFDASSYSVGEGSPVTLTVSLNLTSSNIITVEYATADGTATGGDYTAASGTLTFNPGDLSHTLVINTSDDSEAEDDETFTVQLSNPVSATLGVRDTTTVTIVDNEQSVGGKTVIVDDYELTELITGTDGTADIGWVTWSAPAASSAITLTQVVTAGTPPPIPGVDPSTVLQLDTNVSSGEWAGFTHAFENETADSWTPQNWSTYEGVAFWLYGNNTGGTLFLDVLDNRNPGSTSDDAERWSIDIPDTFSGWQYFEIPFEDFNRKEIGNGAPNDGFTLTEVHGYAFGVFGSVNMGAQTNFVENFSLLVRVTVIDDYELTELVQGMDGTAEIGWITFNAPAAAAAITLTQVVTAGVPEPIPGVDPSTVLQLDTDVSSGEWAGFTHAFENETADSWTPQNWSTYEGVAFWLYGNNTGGTLFLDILDNRNPGSTGDDAERFSLDIPDTFSGWQFFTIPFEDFNRKEIGNGAPNDGFTLTEVHGYAFGAFGSVNMGAQTNFVERFAIYGNTGGGADMVEVAFTQSTYEAAEGDTAVITVTLNITSTDPVMVHYRTAESYATPDRDYTAVSDTLTIPAGSLFATFTVPTLPDNKYEGDENIMLNLSHPVNAGLAFANQAVLTIIEDDPFDPALVHDFEGYHSFALTGSLNLEIEEIMAGAPLAVPGQGTYEQVLSGSYDATSEPAHMTQTFVQGQDWSGYEGLSFWYYGTNSGDTVTVELLDNQITTTADLPPNAWEMVWSDEFNGTAGTPPNPNVWKHELGDGTLNSNPGWGNGESQYYTNSTDNAALDGAGNLALTVHKVNTATSNLECWYGSCEYTSARLISWDRMEYEYGRIEARIQVPTGGDGLWPAFWMLGTDIGEVGWPQSGEIDIMEYVSRIPNEIFGTIHGPGYSGGASFGNTYDFGVPVSQTAHTYAVEWGPDEIHWYVDGINYHSAIPSDVAPNEWVYNHPFFIILNVAIGGNFGGAIDPDIPFPQTMAVDYVRVYQGVNTSERFENSFVDDFTGWRKIVLPFADFTRSAEQPAGAPNDGLTLSETWGYGFHFTEGSSTFRLDRVYLETVLPTDIPPDAVTLSGITNGTVNTTYTFTATIVPATTTTPLTYTWVVAGGSPEVHVVNGLEDTLSLNWADPGTYTITVTAHNSAGSVMATHVVTIAEEPQTGYTLFLPIVYQSQP